MSEDFKLSVSKSKSFNQCKKQYEFNYILKFPKKERDYHTTGKFCHAVLEFFHNQYIAGCLLPYNICMADAFKRAWAEYKEKMTPTMKTECWGIINDYLRSITGKKMNALAMEKRFELNIGDNVILNGAVDMISLDDDNVLHVADFKTSKSAKYLKNDWAQLLTYCYILAMEDKSLTKIRASYIMLRLNAEYITKEFEIDEIMTMKDTYLGYAEQIRNEKEFVPNPTVLCGWCDFLDHCSAGKEKVNSNPMHSNKVYGEVAW